LEVVRLVPQERDRLLRHLLDGPIRVVIAVRSGENDDAEFHPSFLAEGVYSESNMRSRFVELPGSIPGRIKDNG
jgi:hypothetical protein